MGIGHFLELLSPVAQQVKKPIRVPRVLQRFNKPIYSKKPSEILEILQPLQTQCSRHLDVGCISYKANVGKIKSSFNTADSLQNFCLGHLGTPCNPNWGLFAYGNLRGFSKNGSGSDWTDDVVYLDESGEIITSSKGIRSVKPGEDGHIMVGGVKRIFSDAEIVSKIIEIMKRWTWGPEMELQLDRLQFCMKMVHINHVLKSLKEVEVALSLFNWAKRQNWYAPNEQTYDILLDGLMRAGDSNGIQSLLENMKKEGSAVPFRAYKKVIQHYIATSKLEPAFSCFKQMEEVGCLADVETYNSLMSSFLNMGLPYKAFEIYEAMEKSSCRPDALTFEMMIPSLAKSGRLDTAIKLFEDMKAQGVRSNTLIFTSLVDSLGKAGRLDMTMKVYMDMQAAGVRPSASTFVSLVESYVKAGKLEMALKIWDEMKQAGFRPNYALYTMIVEAYAKAGKLDIAMSIFSSMEKAGFLPMASTFSSLVEMHSARGQVDQAMKLYNSMTNAGLRPTLSTYTSLLTALANKKMLDMAAKILLDMKSVGFTADVNASDILMIYIKEGSVDLALRWMRFMSSAGIRTNNFVVRQLFDSCMRNGLYESAKPLLETCVSSAAKVDLVLYTSILAHLVRCQDEQKERLLMSILSTTKYKAHSFICGLFSGPEQRKEPVLSYVRAFFQGIDYESEESGARYFVNVLLNYLVLMGQINRARCIWKVAYENKLFPKAIVFDEHIAWSLDVRHLSVGAGLVAVIHTLHRFRKRMLYYGVIPRRIKIVTGSTLKIVIAHILSTVNSPFEVSRIVLRATGESVLEWFKKPIVQQFLLNEIPSRNDILMHRLNTLFPSSSPEVRTSSSSRTTSLRN
ncbi:hypothetical protein SUGI_1135940 [Cryptomeria japonica]|uniref:pentatricopeptide repeat-containing protein At1g79490, mitochondrial n=1 Tax=Cryptomeria japonica TaxID=3369 RepID=UPI002414817F|nr:pentatricopeptide repeat-containing protein At1g79490, mitochondrial [Cryptomeria japonica]GLJ53301.1 hypothetical protein SUGI_1135940 [Cryptomeria japonica]